MTRLLTTGFESGLSYPYEFSSASSSFSTTSAVKRSGTYSMRMYLTTATVNADISFTASGEVYAGIGFRLDDSLSSVRMSVRSGTTEVARVNPNAGGGYDIYYGTTYLGSTINGLWAYGTWTYIEIGCTRNAVTGFIEVKINGVSRYRYDGNTGSGNLDSLYFYGAATGHVANFYWDDIVVNDTTGVYNNSWPGQPSLIPMQVGSDGDATEWIRGGTDSLANWNQVDEIPGSGADYVYSNTEDSRDLYGLQTVLSLPSGYVINNVIVAHLCRVDSGSGNLGATLKSGSTEVESGNVVSLTSSWTMRSFAFPTDPDGDVAWTQDKVNSVQIGPKNKAI
jgi:hypothetical protein